MRRLSFSVPQLLAASIALVLLSGGTAWWLGRGPAGGTGTAAVPGIEQTAIVRVRAGYDAAIRDLETALAAGEGRLDTATVRIVRDNLAVIDRAIAQARGALAADPANAYLNLHLAEQMRRKLELLRRVNALAVAQS